MKWYWVLFLVFLIALAFGGGFFYHFWITPKDCPMCLCTEGRPAVVTSLALAPDYTRYWGWVGAGFAALGIALLGILIDIDGQLRKIYEKGYPKYK